MDESKIISNSLKALNQLLLIEELIKRETKHNKSNS